MNEIATSIDDFGVSLGGIDRFLRQQLVKQMRDLRHGRLVLEDACGKVVLGEPASAKTDLQVHLHVFDPDFYRAVARHGKIGRAHV